MLIIIFIIFWESGFLRLDSEDDFCSGCRNFSHQLQFVSELLSPDLKFRFKMLLNVMFRGSNCMD